MLILWIRKLAKKNTADQLNDENNNALRKHNETMKLFHMAHPDLPGHNPRDIKTADGNVLAAVRDVKLAKNIQN